MYFLEISPDKVLALLKKVGITTTFQGDIYSASRKNITRPGLYYIIASGSYYALFYNNTWDLDTAQNLIIADRKKGLNVSS